MHCICLTVQSVMCHEAKTTLNCDSVKPKCLTGSQDAERYEREVIAIVLLSSDFWSSLSPFDRIRPDFHAFPD